ncbi:MAG: tyrosine-type recombinase/integrase [Pseudomonadales bacterium]
MALPRLQSILNAHKLLSPVERPEPAQQPAGQPEPPPPLIPSTDRAALVETLAQQGVLALTPPQDMDYWENLWDWSAAAYGAYAARTTQALEQDWQRFVRFCVRYARQPLPASSETLRLYILAHIQFIERAQLPADLQTTLGQIHGELQRHGIERALRPLKIASLERYVAHIAKAHQAAEAPDPTKQGKAQLAMKTARRVADGRQTQRAPIRSAAITAIEQLACATLTERQDVLITLMGRETGARIGAIADIAVEDITFLSDDRSQVTLWRGKTDQANVGRSKRLSVGLTARIRTWLQTAGIEAGPLFRPLAGKPVTPQRRRRPLPSQALSAKAAARSLQRCMARIGVEDVSLIGGHSARIGGGMDIRQDGGDVLAVMEYGGWKSAVMPNHYTQQLAAERNPIHRVSKNTGDSKRPIH